MSALEEGRGTLAETSLVQLLVQALDRRSTGALVVSAGVGDTVIELVGGVPSRVLVADGYARLGELLVERGFVSQEACESALARKDLLLGAALVEAGATDEATVKRALLLQVLKRAVRLFALPPNATWQFCAGDPRFAALPPGERVDSLRILAAGLSEHGAEASRIDLVLALLDDVPLVLREDVSLDRFGFQGEFLAAVTLILAEQPSFEALVASKVASVEVCRRLVYLLATARFLRQGDDARLMAKATPSAPGSLAREDLAAGTPRKVTRIQLKRMAVARTEAHVEDGALDGLDGEGAPPLSVSTPLPVEDEPAPESRLSDEELRERILYLLSREQAAPAQALCELALKRSPDDLRLLATSAWIRSQLPRPDLKVLALELDDVLLVDPNLAVARHYRGLLRRRLGQDGGARQDFERVLAQEPNHHGARAQLAELASSSPPSVRR